MRILFWTPFQFNKPEADDAMDRLLASTLSSVRDGVEVVVDHLPHVEGTDDEIADAHHRGVVDKAKTAHNNYDAMVVGCHYDPAVPESRTVASIPVIGPLQLSTSLAMQYGQKYAVVTDTAEAEPVLRQLMVDYGLDANCAEVTSIGWDMDEIVQDPDGAAHAVDVLVRRLRAHHDLGCVVIGCTIVSAAYESSRGTYPESDELVMNTNLVAVESAAALVRAIGRP